MSDPLSTFQACGASWDAMAPLGDGRRFCARCERPVTDLRGLTLAELSLVHAMSDEPVCGVYTPDQLRPDAPPEPPRRYRSPLVTLALGATLLAARAEAQTTAAPAQSEHAQLPPGATSENTPRSETVHESAGREDTLVVTGTVRDRDGSAIRAATVFIQGTPWRTVTDTAGGFVLRIPGSGRREVQLQVARLGYEMKTVALAVTGSRVEAAISLEEGKVQLGGLITATPTALDRDRMKEREEGFSVARIRLDNP